MFNKNFGAYRLGWLKDYPDVRDYNLDSKEVSPFVIKGLKDILPSSGAISVELPKLRAQENLGSCTAHAGTYVFEVHQRTANLGDEPMSRLFLYKVSRKLAGVEGDAGSYLRMAMQAIVMFGVPPESYYPYEVAKYDNEPVAFDYAIAQNYQALTYYRLDPVGATPEQVIDRVKANIIANRACMFGFVVYGIDEKTGNVLLPAKNQSMSGGHAVVATSFLDEYEIIHPSGQKTIGSFRFANWWGSDFGDNGFGYLPYEFVRLGLATDWWTIMTTEWVDLGQFK